MAKTAGGGSKADTAVKLVLIFFISLLSFTVGTLVGGQFEKTKTHQMALENDGQNNMAAHDEASDVDAAPITNEDIESLEEFVRADSKQADRQVASVDNNAAPAVESTQGKDGYTHASQLKAKADESAAAERVAQDKAPAPDPKKVREPEKTLPMVASTTIGKFTVQVASYATEQEATDHATKLKEKGYNAFYIPATVNGKTWYRVSVGRFEDQKSATAYRKELLDSQVATSAIVQKVLQ